MDVPITLFNNPILRKIAKPISQEEFGTKYLKETLQKMADALRTTDDGIGIAAPQIAVSKRIFLASEEALAIDEEKNNGSDPDRRDNKKAWKYFTFINPEIIKVSSKKERGSEGCLSVPNKYGMVERHSKIRVRALDENGKQYERGASGLFARLLQHEIDHLNGVLFIDKAKELKTIAHKHSQ